MTTAHRWNSDKKHRCPECHAVAVDMERPRSWRVYSLGNRAGPRWVQIQELVGQDDRWWKVADVAEALGVDNRRSLRVAME